MGTFRQLVRPLRLLGMLSAAGCSSILMPGELELTVSADRTTASPGDPAVVHVTARNTGRDDAVWGPGSSTCQLHLVVEVDGEEQFVPFDRICNADLSPLSLEPGESRTEAFEWDGRVQHGGSADSIDLLAPGTYKVRGAAWQGPRSLPILIEVRVP